MHDTAKMSKLMTIYINDVKVFSNTTVHINGTYASTLVVQSCMWSWPALPVSCIYDLQFEGGPQWIIWCISGQSMPIPNPIVAMQILKPCLYSMLKACIHLLHGQPDQCTQNWLDFISASTFCSVLHRMGTLL